MSPVVAYALATTGGYVLAWALLEATVIRRARRENARLIRERGRLIAALRPFVPVRVRTIHTDLWGVYRPEGRPSWRCDYHDLLGGCFGDATAGSREVHDEAREHFTSEHLTRAAFERARTTLTEIAGDHHR